MPNERANSGKQYANDPDKANDSPAFSIPELSDSDTIEQIILSLELGNLSDNYPEWHSSYSLEGLLKAFILKEIKGLDNETELARYLEENPDLDLGLETAPDQSTLWRTWNKRFDDEHREFVKQAAEVLISKAIEYNIPVPDSTFQEEDKEDVSDRTRYRFVSNKTKEVTQRAKELIYPSLHLDREENAAIHENAFWDLQTYIGMRDSMAVNEGARSFMVDSTRDRTPLGHNHRHHLKKHSVTDFREMYSEAVSSLVQRARQHSEFDRGVTVAIDITEGDFYGDRTGHENEILGSKNDKHEWGHQWATIQIVGQEIPVVLDVIPVTKGLQRNEIVAELLDNALEHVNIWRVLMDREFASGAVLKEIEDRDLYYLVPKPKRNTDRRRIREMNKAGVEKRVIDRRKHLGTAAHPELREQWIETKELYVPKENWDGELENGHENMVVFLSNFPDVDDETAIGHVERYRERWGIENGYKKIKEFMALTTSKDFNLRYFYFAFACLLYNVWRLVDVLVKQSFGKEGAREPLVTANDFLTIAKKFVDPGG